MIILGTNSIKAAGGFNVANSCRFNGTSSDYLTKTPSSSGNRKTWTASVWLKGQPSTTTNNIAGQAVYSAGSAATDRTHFYFTNGIFEFRSEIGNTQQIITTNQVFTDPSAWYHIVVAVDSTQSTDTNRVKIYANGVQITSFSAAAYLAQNADTYVNHTVIQTVGRSSWVANQASGSYWNGYMAEFVLLDGTAATPTDFGEFDGDSGIWKPIDVSGLTAGTNGFYLDFEDSANLGNDAFGGTDLDEYNLTAVDQSTDTCTNNFATLNPLSVNSDQGTFSEGNLQLLHGSNAFRTGFASIGASQGKWYCEIKRVTATSFAVGVISLDFKSITPNITYMGGVGTPNLGYFRDGNTGVNGSETSGYASYADGDTLMIGLDLDNGKVYFGKNGTWGNSGDPTSGATGTGARSITVGGETWSFGVSVYNATAQCNFGSPPYAISSGNTDGDGFGNFEYAVPSGYFSLCTKNLAEYG